MQFHPVPQAEIDLVIEGNMNGDSKGLLPYGVASLNRTLDKQFFHYIYCSIQYVQRCHSFCFIVIIHNKLFDSSALQNILHYSVVVAT
jgi:hypothetical protein